MLGVLGALAVRPAAAGAWKTAIARAPVTLEPGAPATLACAISQPQKPMCSVTDQGAIASEGPKLLRPYRTPVMIFWAQTLSRKPSLGLTFSPGHQCRNPATDL